MNKRMLFPIVLMIFLLSACRVVRGSGDVKTEVRAVSDFDQVSLSGQGELIVTQGDQESLEIEAEDNIIAVIETEVKDNTLHIGAKANTTIRPTEPVKFHLTMKDINGSGAINIGSLTAESLTVDINGAGD